MEVTIKIKCKNGQSIDGTTNAKARIVNDSDSTAIAIALKSALVGTNAIRLLAILAETVEFIEEGTNCEEENEFARAAQKVVAYWNKNDEALGVRT